MMWQPQMPMLRGGRPGLGVRGFPPVMMGADGFSYGAVIPDNFAAPDLFGVPPRVFAPYGGPRFSGDFSATGAMPGLVFPGRPPGAVFPVGGLGMMMGPGRAPFMNGMGVARGNRPIGVPPFLHPPPPPPNNRVTKRDQRRQVGDRYEQGSEQGNKGQESAGPSGGQDEETGYQPGPKAQLEDKFSSRNSFQNDESESDDEAAPRRWRHGERNKKWRGSEGEAVSDHWETTGEHHYQ